MSKGARRTFSVAELIVRKRDGRSLDEHEIRELIAGYVDGTVADYQMSALAMAVFFQGMSFEETFALTLAMRDSGRVLDLASIAAPKVDKHSTGGVGDKVSICLAPLVAACGVVVPMMSGRGLGHTGGTLDKLEAIPGFRVDLSVRELQRQLHGIGCALIGQTADLAPADRRLYALRDVTGTVESVPLITSSILSKKLSEGIDALVLDVKVGRGAFMKTEAEARDLARCLVRVGQLAGKEVRALLTDMSSPIGQTVGNALETAEAFEVLHGNGPEDLQELTYALGAEMLRAGGVATTRVQAARMMKRAVNSGAALEKMRRVVRAQGGDARVVDEPDRLPLARYHKVVKASAAGFITEIDALELGYASMGLGAGRIRAEDGVDPGAGVRLHVGIGDRVHVGAKIATVYASKRGLVDRGAERVSSSVRTGKRPITKGSRILATIRR